MLPRLDRSVILILTAACFLITLFGCRQQQKNDAVVLNVPRGYVPVLEVMMDDQLMGFGPFVGYYFKPETAGDLTRLKFVCFNERSFYTLDVPENAKIFEGDAILAQLSDVDFEIPVKNRINPVFFEQAPSKWLKNRPEPRDEFVHFHSCFDSQRPIRWGYWVRHYAVASFTYDMGKRVGPDSPLYHRVNPGIDKSLARIIEFDQGSDAFFK